MFVSLLVDISVWCYHLYLLPVVCSIVVDDVIILGLAVAVVDDVIILGLAVAVAVVVPAAAVVYYFLFSLFTLINLFVVVGVVIVLIGWCQAVWKAMFQSFNCRLQIVGSFAWLCLTSLAYSEDLRWKPTSNTPIHNQSGA